MELVEIAANCLLTSGTACATIRLVLVVWAEGLSPLDGSSALGLREPPRPEPLHRNKPTPMNYPVPLVLLAMLLLLLLITAAGMKSGYSRATRTNHRRNAMESEPNTTSITSVWQTVPRPASWFAEAAKIEAREMGRGVPMGLPTGFSTIDSSFRMKEGQLVVLAARSSMGKTSLALQIAMNNAIRLQAAWDDGVVLFFSAEMSGAELFHKMASIRSGLNLQDGHAGRWTQQQGNDFIAILDELSSLPLVINDLNQIKTEAMRDGIQLLSDVGKPVRMIVFDYIELGADDDKFKEHERVAQVVQRLKRIALDFKIPVLALSQINREIEKESRHRMPLIHNLAGSDSVGRTADKVLTMLIPNYYLKTGVSCACEYIEDSHRTAYISVQKDRFGARGTIWRLAFDPKTASFHDIDTSDFRGRYVHKLNTRQPSEAENYWQRHRWGERRDRHRAQHGRQRRRAYAVPRQVP